MYRKKRYLISYDISKDKIRNKVRTTLTKFGYRIQYSCYLCEVTKREKIEITNKIVDLIFKKDTVIWIPISDQLLTIIEIQGKLTLISKKTSPKIL
jgi:CRISPR-associated protein Cas2